MDPVSILIFEHPLVESSALRHSKGLATLCPQFLAEYTEVIFGLQVWYLSYSLLKALAPLFPTQVCPYSQDTDGNTPLHLAVFHGHERTAWAILCTGSPDLDIENNAGQTAMVMGYLMLWQRPAESAIRAVLTLSQVMRVAVRTVNPCESVCMRKIFCTRFG